MDDRELDSTGYYRSTTSGITKHRIKQYVERYDRASSGREVRGNSDNEYNGIGS